MRRAAEEASNSGGGSFRRPQGRWAADGGIRGSARPARTPVGQPSDLPGPRSTKQLMLNLPVGMRRRWSPFGATSSWWPADPASLRASGASSGIVRAARDPGYASSAAPLVVRRTLPVGEGDLPVDGLVRPAVHLGVGV